MPAKPRVLIIDDDPSHLDIYGMIVQRAGFESIPLVVKFTGADPIPDSGVDLVLLDYRLNSITSAAEIAQEIRSKFPNAPIVLLSDFWTVPADVAPFISEFIRKGDAAKLIEVLSSHLSSE